MNLSLKEIIKIWREEELKDAPNKHPDKTPSCLLFAQIVDFVKGLTELTDEEKKHVATCPYCQKAEAVFRNESEALSVIELIWTKIGTSTKELTSLFNRIQDINQLGMKLAITSQGEEDILNEETEIEQWYGFLLPKCKIAVKQQDNLVDLWFESCDPNEMITGEPVRIIDEKGIILWEGMIPDTEHIRIDLGEGSPRAK